MAPRLSRGDYSQLVNWRVGELVNPDSPIPPTHQWSRSLKGAAQAQASGPRGSRMRVDVLDARQRFTGQTRREVVVDVAHLRVEQVEHLERNANALADVIAALRVHEARRLRA